MSEAVHPGPARFPRAHRPARARRAQRSRQRPIPTVLARPGAAADLEQVSRRRPATARSTKTDFHIRWYADGELNLSVNCLDRHLAEHGDRIALIFEADEPGEGHNSPTASSTKRPAASPTCSRQRGISRGDRVMIYMPMIPEAAAAMLACARIGAIHSVIFGGFSPDSLAGRIADCDACAVITADEGVRGGKRIPLKRNVDAALETARRRHGDRRHPHGRRRADEAGARHSLLGRARRPRDRLRAGDHERRRPAVHPLHVGLDREAEGRRPLDRRLFGLGGDDLRLDLRLPAGRHLLVHRRRRLDHRPQLRRLRPARDGRDQRHVRRRPQLPRFRPLLGDGRPAWRHHLLHRADRHPRPDARRRRAGEAAQPQVAAPARHGRRADQPGGLGMVLARRRRRPLPGRRHLVADRDRRHPHLALPRRHRR